MVMAYLSYDKQVKLQLETTLTGHVAKHQTMIFSFFNP